MSDLQTFLNMGGYAVYVWSSFGIALVVLAANIIWGQRQLSIQKQRARTLAEKKRSS